VTTKHPPEPVLALIYNGIGIPLAAGALYPLWGIRLSR
jgi:hypothetical protein